MRHDGSVPLTTTDPAPRPGACSALSADEPLPGTAAHERRWTLLEFPGHWGRDVLDGEALGDELATRLRAHLAACGTRLLFVRRPGREGQHVARPRVHLCDTRPGGHHGLVGTVDGPADLLGLDLSGSTVPDGFRPLAGPLALVCTHGRRDQCCAVRGRPVAAHLHAELGARLHELDPDAGVWECSHTGGHRFAPVLLLPGTGYTYGSVTAAQHVGAVRAALDGRVATTGLRGRSTWPPAGQVAEVAVRASGLDAGVDELTVEVDADDPLGARVAHVDGRCWEVRVSREPLPPRANSCGKAPGKAWAWRVDELRAL